MAREKIDTRQLKALLKIGFKVELRGAKNPFGGMLKKKAGFPPLVGIIIFYFMIGIILSIVMAQSLDLFVSAFVLCSCIMIFIAITVLLEFSETVLTPQDYAIVGPQPVNSRTFFAAKLLNLLIFVAILGVTLGVVPTIVGTIVQHNLLMAPVLLLTVIGTALATATFFVIFYALMLHVSSREKMNSMLGYLQLLLIFGFYAVMIALPSNIDTITTSLAGFDKWYLYLIPSAWFASWPAIIVDGLTPARTYAAVAGGLALIVCYSVALSRLSIGYARTLNENVARKRVAVAKKKGLFAGLWRYLAGPEERVVSKLIGAQFKYDNRFKITILSIIPLAALYLYMGIRDGKSLVDPFIISHVSSTSPNIMFYVAVALLPLMVIAGTSYSSAYQAAWIFFTSPADRVRLVLATKRFAIIYFCLPFLIVVFVLLSLFFHSVLHAALHSLTMFLLCTIAIAILVIMIGKVPFSLPLRRGSTTASYFVSLMVPLVLILPPMIVIAKVGYGSAEGYLIWVGILLALNLAINFVQNRIVARRVAKYEFLAE
jgi:hypothetical protein